MARKREISFHCGTYRRRTGREHRYVPLPPQNEALVFQIRFSPYRRSTGSAVHCFRIKNHRGAFRRVLTRMFFEATAHAPKTMYSTAWNVMRPIVRDVRLRRVMCLRACVVEYIISLCGNAAKHHYGIAITSFARKGKHHSEIIYNFPACYDMRQRYPLKKIFLFSGLFLFSSTNWDLLIFIVLVLL